MPGSPLPHRYRADLLCLAALTVALSLLVLNRAAFDIWLARNDNLTAYMPWYTELGERLRAGQIPGWNPHQFSGTPFAGDPQSGWMYLPAMVSFTLFAPAHAMIAKLAVELAVATFATYAFVRVLGYSPIAALTGAALYTFGPLSFQTAYCCTVRSHLGAWLPLMLLGAELVFAARSRTGRLAALMLGGFGLSQIFAGWLGQGALNAALILGAYCVYRALAGHTWSNRSRPRRITARFLLGGVVTLAVGLTATLLDAAALLPRLAVNTEMNLAGADYRSLPSGYNYPPYAVKTLVAALLNDDFVQRRMTIPAAGLVLVLIALLALRRARAVAFFAGLTVALLSLAMSAGPVYWLLSLVPHWQELHDHYPPQVTAGLAIGPAVLAAAGLDHLPRLMAGRCALFVLLLPMLALGAAYLWLADAATTSTGLTGPLVVVLIALALVLALRFCASARATRLVQIGLALLVVVEPSGLELVGSISPWDPVTGWATSWSPDPKLAAAPDIALSPDDAGGAGQFLQQRMATEGPFRYVGYGGVGYPGAPEANVTYMIRRAQPQIQAILVNGRAIFLDLYDTQGYNPVQLSRYTDYVLAMNRGTRQDYHLANLRPQGVSSPLLDALHVRYILIDARLPPDRDDVLALTADRPLVFSNANVRVYENPRAYPTGWIVHDVQVQPRAAVAAALTAGTVDPAATALIESGSVPTASLPAGATDTTAVTRYDPEHITLTASAGADGLLVLSEIYEAGWQAYVDGRLVPILPTDLALRGIPLTAGMHTVELRYEPASLRIGLIVSLLAHLVLLIVVILAAVRVRRTRPVAAG